MKPINKLTLMAAVLLGCATSLHAAYTEVMDPDGPSKNLKTDFGLVDDGAKTNQSDIFQKAIDEVAAAGGGRLIVPKGTYQLASVKLKSNIHLLFEAGTVIKPFWPEGSKAVVFNLDAEDPANRKKATPEEEQAYIENVSLRGIDGPWIIDYSDREREKGDGVRGVLTKMVKNFLIADLDVKDNYSTYCGITLTPTDAKDITGWKISRSTDGTVRNCRIFNASPGYGLTQLHGAQSVHFEDLYADGGVTLRLETGAVGYQTGVFDITAKNIVSENGRCALMLGPHSANNGVVQVDGVKSISSTYAVQIGKGGVKKQQLKIQPDAKDGTFAAGSYVKNIHAVFGKTAQVKAQAMMGIAEEYYPDLELVWENKFFRGPSIGAVEDSSGDLYDVKIENVTLEGFKYNADKPILSPEDDRPGKWGEELRKWKVSKGLPADAKPEKTKKEK